MKNIEFIICVVLTVATAFVIAIWVPTPDHDPMKKVQLAVAYGMLVLLILFGFLVLAAIASGRIDISALLSEVGGGASMSRFQLLIFTFVSDDPEMFDRWENIGLLLIESVSHLEASMA